MARHNLQEIHDFMIEVAEKAGRMITSATPSTGGSDMKKNSADLVTETDQAVEKMVSTALLEKYPSFKFMGEETYQPGMRLTNDPTFIVDPIDGTCNFVHAYPYVSISLGLTIDRKPTVGVVFNPFTHSLYSAITGRGAYLNRTHPLPLKSSSPTAATPAAVPAPNPLPTTSSAAARSLEPLNSLQDALIAFEWGSDRRGPDFDLKAQMYTRLCRTKEDGGAMVQGVRSLGSAALNLCGVAEGSLDVYWESGCWAWDVCAGWLMVVESGGMVVDGNPGNWEPEVDDRRYLAVRKGGSRGLVEEFWAQMEGRLSYGAG